MTVWDALSRPARRTRIRPAGMRALDVVRLEAGLIMLEVDYTSARHAMNPEQNYSPCEIGLGGSSASTRATSSAGGRSRPRGAAGGPARRLVGLQLDWYDIEGLFDAQGLPPGHQSRTSTARRSPSSPTAARSGKATSHGWSPILKQAIALAFVPARYERVGTKLEVEWTVEGRRGRVAATRRRAAVPRPPAQARMTDGGAHPGAVPPRDRDEAASDLRPPDFARGNRPLVSAARLPEVPKVP